MKEKCYSLSTFWDKRTVDEKTKLSRIILCINLNRKQFRLSLKLKSTKEDFDKAVSAARVMSDKAKELRRFIHDYLLKAETLLDRLPNPTQETFTRLFKSETDLVVNNKTNVVPFFQGKINDLKAAERFSTVVNNKLALSSLLKYKSELLFEDIDKKWLSGYVSWMVSKGNSVTTANIYLRALRTIFNDVVEAGIVSEKHYPFKGFPMGSKVRSKSVLYPSQMKLLLDYKAVGIRENRAKAYFFFCYLGNGMNFRDASMLQWKNIKGNILTFVRHKTKNTNKSEKEIKVYMHDLLKAIIEEYGNTSRNPDDYVLPICNNKMTALQMNDAIIRYKWVSNKSLSKIGKGLGFDVHLCLNLARHSFATKMKIDKVPIANISEFLGHSNCSVTEHYTKSLPDEFVKEMSSNLLNFDSSPKMLVI